MNYCKYKYIEIVGNPLQCFKNYHIKHTVKHLKGLKWHEVTEGKEKKIWARDNDGKYTFEVFKKGRGVRVLLSLEGSDKECNHGCYDIFLHETAKGFNAVCNPSVVAMRLPHMLAEGKDFLLDWNLNGENADGCAEWGIKKALGWVEYVTGHKVA